MEIDEISITAGKLAGILYRNAKRCTWYETNKDNIYEEIRCAITIDELLSGLSIKGITVLEILKALMELQVAAIQGGEHKGKLEGDLVWWRFPLLGGFNHEKGKLHYRVFRCAIEAIADSGIG